MNPFLVFGAWQAGASGKMIAAQKTAVHEADLADLTIQQIAADTGGKAFVNTNGFQEAIQQALADGANYYTIGYLPQLKDYSSFRRIKVSVNGGYQLAYRDGYYADSAQSAANSSASTMKEAIQFGAPPPSDILFKVRVIPASDSAAKGFTPAPGPAGADAKNLKPPLTRYLIDYMVDAHHFTFRRTPDGVAHTRPGVYRAGLRCRRQGHRLHRARLRARSAPCALRADDVRRLSPAPGDRSARGPSLSAHRSSGLSRTSQGASKYIVARVSAV
jgi:hypothetical protein